MTTRIPIDGTPIRTSHAGPLASAASRLVLCCSLLVAAAACSSGTATTDGLEDATTQEIRNGDPAFGPAFNGIGDLLANGSAEACTGSLISKSVVLTAAQCLVGAAPGRTFSLRRRRMAPIVAGVPHPGFDTPDGINIVYDVALVRLDRSVTSQWGGVTRYPVRGTQMPTLVHATGVGFGESGTSGAVRRQGDLLVTQYIASQGAGGSEVPDAFLEVQPGDAKDQMFCQGDQGGPLLFEGQITGTASFRSVATCAEPGPGYYVSTQRFADWIAQTVADLDPPGACPREDDAALATLQGGCKELATGQVFSAPGPARLPWTDAAAYCGQLTEAGVGGWRLPTLAELSSYDAHRIVRTRGFRQPDPELRGLFWSATAGTRQRAVAWDFSTGRAQLVQTTRSLRPLCVRTPTADLCAGVTCAAADQCHSAGTCDPATGRCGNPPLPDGTTCNDNNLCTRSEVCTAGVCGGGTGCDANASCSGAGCACNPQYSGDGFTCTHLPVDCVLSDWSAFSDCSAACGGGTQTRTRTIVTPPAYGGAACGPLTETAACNPQACVVPPVIIGQPANQTVDEGTSATFSAAASGTPPFTWQWRRRAGPLAAWADLAGATGPTLIVTPVAAVDSGAQFSVVVTNAAGADASAAATLTVNPYAGVVIVVQPADTSVNSGTTATFTVVATGVPAPTYQWQRWSALSPTTPFSDIPGATSATLTTNTVRFEDSGSRYQVLVSNALGGLTSNVATLSVVPPPLTGFDQITTGYSHTLLLKGGQVWSMGTNEQGQLGHAAPVTRGVPSLVEGLPGPVAKVLARGQTSFAILTDGTVWTWGYNGSGQLGNASIPQGGHTVVPVPVLRDSDGQPLGGIMDLVASDAGTFGGSQTVIGLTAAGAAWDWGSAYNEPNTPAGFGDVLHLQAVPNFLDGSSPQTTVKRLALGNMTGLVITGDGQLGFWFRFGYGDTTVRPVPGIGLNTAADVVGAPGGTWFITTDGRVFAYPSYLTYDLQQVLFPFPVDWMSMGSANDVNFAHDRDTGALYSWGNNWAGQLGNGTIDGGNPQPSDAVQVLLIDDATQVTAGYGYALALRPGGAVWGWGYGWWGALGTTTSPGFTVATPYQLTGN